VRAAYPYAVDSVSTFSADRPFHEMITTLAYLAGCTERIRLGPNVLIIPYRPPLYTAKQLTMLTSSRAGD
jgi:alkanesulfonate monooxygenase SsuD/methylene tetrahydromethanopterin reductase-like flavin-dependent oxidoreductase (luciferase family)